MMIMRPPQHGHACASVGSSSGLVASASSDWIQGVGALSNSRARAMLAARLLLANSP